MCLLPQLSLNSTFASHAAIYRTANGQPVNLCLFLFFSGFLKYIKLKKETHILLNKLDSYMTKYMQTVKFVLIMFRILHHLKFCCGERVTSLGSGSQNLHTAAARR